MKRSFRPGDAVDPASMTLTAVYPAELTEGLPIKVAGHMP